MLAFFETLRVELGSDVKITIVTPGVIESEFTKGKVWTEGGMKVDQELRDVSYLHSDKNKFLQLLFRINYYIHSYNIPKITV